MEIFWFVILISTIIIYAVLDGYDFGAGIVHLFIAKKEKDKEVIHKAIGPFWDANEVWLIAAGGMMFFAFPVLYASVFSGFYLPLIMILWMLIFRALGLEFRGVINNTLWYKLWDKAFGVASLLLALFFGAALGNIVRGVNLGGVELAFSKYEAHYFFTPLWNESFSPLAVHEGILDWFTVLIGILAVITLTIHGANWIVFKTNSSINQQLKKLIPKLNILMGLLTVLTIYLWVTFLNGSFKNLSIYIYLSIFPFLAIIGFIGLFFTYQFKNDGYGFLASSLFIIGGLGTTAAALFPTFLPSTNSINPALTIYNTGINNYGYEIGLQWWIAAILLVTVYFVIQHKVFKGKLDELDYGDH
jgi:cytochrome d ubiquinol oxidase subunit II